MLETTNMSAAEFAERLAESAKIIKYTFRMEIPKEEQDLQDNLVACSLDQAYRMAKPLFLDRWKNHPFLRNPEFKQESNQQVKSESGSEAKLNSDQQAKLNSDQQAKLNSDQQAKLNSDQQAKLNSDQQAKLNSDQQAKLNSDQQAKLNSDQQAKQEERKKSFKEEGEKILCDAAVAELYCIIRKIIGEENLLTTYAASEYAFFDSKAFDTEKVDILSNFATGMDDLINRKIYRFDNTQPLTFEKEKLKTEILGEKLSSRNQSLKITTNNVDAKLTAFLPGYRSFFHKEKTDISISPKNQRTILKSSDLDLMVILKRSAKKMDILENIQKARENHTVLSMRQIQNLQILHKELTSLYEQQYDDKKVKNMTAVKLEHLTAADNLYIQMELERTMNCTMLANLLKNFQEFSDEQTIVMFADPASIRLFSRCFELGNIYNRTEILNLTFQGLQNSSTLLRDPDSFSMDTWEYDVRNELEGRMVGLEEEKKISFFEQWKKVYEEEMDSWSNWIFPLFMSCFCVVLNENIRKQQMTSKEDDEKAMQIMYMKLAEYINKKDLKMDTMVIDDSLLEEAKKSSITKKVISNYILSAMQKKDRMSIPVTIKEIDEIMPKDNKLREEENYYLNYAIIQFLKRNR